MAARFLRMAGAIGLTIVASACGPSSAQKAADPATVSGHVAETDLVTVTLTPEAEQRLGIVVTPMERRTVAQTRTLGGEVIAPAGGASAATRYAATASLEPSQLASAQIEADSAVERARVAFEAARTRFERISALFEAQAESARVRDDARAELQTAEATLQAARAQRALLGQSIGSTRAAPRIWVRASVYGGDLARLNRRGVARVTALGTSGTSRAGQPVQTPATASAISGASFVFYEVDNRDGAFRMGDRVNVAIPTNDQQEALTAPYSAILYDINGGEWVYERTGDHVFTRRRVEVRTIVGDVAVLARGPAEGAQIVSVGAPELFGTEFGVSH